MPASLSPRPPRWAGKYTGKDQANGQFQDNYLGPLGKPIETETLGRTVPETFFGPVKHSNNKNGNIH